MSVAIKIVHAKKKYGNRTVIEDLSLDIKGGEFFTLLGPSGCGKTTLLRMIAGFNTIEGGDFYLGDRRINTLDPSKRNIGMVFQNYAIFPHLTVRQNVEFGLKARKMPADKIKKETDEFLKLMQIEEFAERIPERLSGGQQQRVALARALVIRPDILLMDEPLSNLDAKLRLEMRTVIRDIQNQLKITTVYVTHDQEEAMAISDRIAVMKDGVIQQIGSPRQLYQRPTNTFVASFIGRTNILQAKLVCEGLQSKLVFPDGFEVGVDTIDPKNRVSQNVQVSVRPEDINFVSGGENGISGTVDTGIFLGLMTNYFIKLASGERILTIQVSRLANVLEKGESVKLLLDTEKINIFSEDGTRNLILPHKDAAQ